MSKLCLIFNLAPKYREGIFRLIDNEYDCDWYFGKNETDIRGLDLDLLKHVTLVENVTVFRKPFYFQKNILPLLWNSNYQTYFVLGELFNLSTWLFILLKPIVSPRKHIYFWTHGWYGKESRIRKILKKIFFKQVDGIFLYGNYAKQLMIKEGFDEKRLFVIHNSLDYDLQLSLRKDIKPSSIYISHFDNRNRNILFIGRLTAVKRLDMLIDAISKLKEQHEFYNLIFVGDGSERMKLENYAKEKNVYNCIWFYGACYDERVNAELIYNADLCVAPGNVGLTAMHTMVFGTPVITHDCFKYQMPEFEAIHKGVTGDFFQRNSVDSLVNCIKNWFTPSNRSREEIRKNCYHEIDNYWTPEFQMEVIRKNLKLRNE